MILKSLSWAVFLGYSVYNQVRNCRMFSDSLLSTRRETISWIRTFEYFYLCCYSVAVFILFVYFKTTKVQEITLAI